MRYWLKVTGTGDRPVEDDWRPRWDEWRREQGEISAFPRRPRIRRGDRLVLYASGSPQRYQAGRFYALEEVLSDKPELGAHDRWGWVLATRLVLAGPLISRAPTLDGIGVRATSVMSKSHIRLTDEQGAEAGRLLTEGADG